MKWEGGGGGVVCKSLFKDPHALFVLLQCCTPQGIKMKAFVRPNKERTRQTRLSDNNKMICFVSTTSIIAKTRNPK